MQRVRFRRTKLGLIGSAHGLWRRAKRLHVSATLAIAYAGSSSVAAQEGRPPAQGLTLSAAVARTLERDAQIARARWSLAEAEGALMRAEGAFDLSLTTTALREDAGGAADSTGPSPISTRYDVGLGQRLRNGMVVSPRIVVRRTPLPSVDYNVADVGLALTVPLLRGRGGGMLTASEEAVRSGRDASARTLEHQRATTVLLVVQAYWRYVASARRLDVLRQAEDRALRLLEETRRLIEAQERPASDEVRVRANHVLKNANRLAAEGALIDARGALAVAMGVAAEELAAVPLPATPLPDLSADTVLPTPAAAAGLATARRRDLVAASYRADAAAALLSGAQRETRPRFDLSFGLGYGGAAIGSPVDAISAGGVRTSLGVSLGLPLENHDAAGFALQEQARSQRAEIERDDLAREISIDAATAASRLRAAAAQLRRAHEATGLFDKDVKSEETRFRLGVSTLFDLFYAQDALTTAALGELDAQLSYATSLAHLRFETATLFEDAGGASFVNIDGLLAWPSSRTGARPPGPGSDGRGAPAASAPRTGPQ